MASNSANPGDEVLAPSPKYAIVELQPQCMAMHNTDDDILTSHVDFGFENLEAIASLIKTDLDFDGYSYGTVKNWIVKQALTGFSSSCKEDDAAFKYWIRFSDIFLPSLPGIKKEGKFIMSNDASQPLRICIRTTRANDVASLKQPAGSFLLQRDSMLRFQVNNKPIHLCHVGQSYPMLYLYSEDYADSIKEIVVSVRGSPRLVITNTDDFKRKAIGGRTLYVVPLVSEWNFLKEGPVLLAMDCDSAPSISLKFSDASIEKDRMVTIGSYSYDYCKLPLNRAK